MGAAPDARGAVAFAAERGKGGGFNIALPGRNAGAARERQNDADPSTSSSMGPIARKMEQVVRAMGALLFLSLSACSGSRHVRVPISAQERRALNEDLSGTGSR